jgi:hypothetical protein
MRRRAQWIELLGPVIAMLLALVIYLGWRHGLWLHAVGGFRGAALLHLPVWVRYSLPDALWQYAFASVVLWIWRDTAWTLRKTLWCFIPVTLGVGVELGQLARILPGTFDVRDLVLSLVACTVAFLIHTWARILRRATV